MMLSIIISCEIVHIKCMCYNGNISIYVNKENDIHQGIQEIDRQFGTGCVRC